MMGCASEPPHDVAHVQFQSRIAFKLVWAPGPEEAYESFVLVDDGGELLATGFPTGLLPDLRERQYNYRVVQGSKYAKAADHLASQPGVKASAVRQAQAQCGTGETQNVTAAH